MTIKTIFSLLPMTRGEFANALGVSVSKLEAWLGERPRYREPSPEDVKRAGAILKRHVENASAVLNGETRSVAKRRETTTPARTGGARDVALAVSLLPVNRSVLAARLGVSRARLDSWLDGAAKYREPHPDVVRRARWLYKRFLDAVQAREMDVLGAVWEREERLGDDPFSG